jgi:hypothetical protein
MKRPISPNVAWIVAGVCGSIAFVASIVALMYPDNLLYEAACAVGSQSACDELAIHRWALGVLAIAGVLTIIEIIEGAVLMSRQRAVPPQPPYYPQFGPPQMPYAGPPSVPLPSQYTDPSFVPMPPQYQPQYPPSPPSYGPPTQQPGQ